MMIKNNRAIAVAFLALLLGIAVGGSPIAADEKDGDSAGNRYIVVFRDNVADARLASLSMTSSRSSVGLKRVYNRALKGFAAEMTPGEARRLENNPNVAFVEPDLKVHTQVQPVPRGIVRIQADRDNAASTNRVDERVDVDVAIIDTGLDVDHPDLNIAGGIHFYDFFFQDSNFDDDNGHGTHVGGTVGALDNNIGVVGVAPGARLWGVKVLNAGGSGYISDVIAGIDWVTANADTIEIANLSLGTQGRSDALHAAIKSSVEAGVVFIVAAGNAQIDVFGWDGIYGNSDDFIPAAYPEVAAISALADFDGVPGGKGSGIYPFHNCTELKDDSFACFSNYAEHDHTGVNKVVNSPGGAIDMMLPGVGILSTWPDGGAMELSGTSMAAPHAAGLAALYIASNGRAANATEVYDIRQALIDMGMSQKSGNRLTILDEPDSMAEVLGWARQLRDMPPIVSIVSPKDGSTLSETVTVQVDAADGQDAAGTLTVDYAIDGGSYSAMAYNPASGYYEANWDAATAGDGPHTIDARATDSAGGTTAAAAVSVTAVTDVMDIAITSVSATSTSVAQGSALNVDVAVQNGGNQDAGSFIVTLTDITDGLTIGTTTVSTLASASSTVVTFSWNTAGASPGAHTLEASHSLADDDSANDSAQANVLVAAANPEVTAAFTEDWIEQDGSPWPSQWSFDNANQARLLDISGNRGRVGKDSGVSGPGIVTAYINTTEAQDVDAAVTFSINSNAMRFGMVARRSDSEPDTYYYTRVEGSKGSLDIYKVVNGVRIRLGRTEIYPVIPNMDWKMRFVVATNGPSTELKAKVWDARGPEPPAFQLEETDQDVRLQGVSGRFGLYYDLFRNRIAYTDDYTAQVTP